MNVVRHCRVVSFVFLPRDGCTVNGKRPRSPIKGAARRSLVAPLPRLKDSWLARREVEAKEADSMIEVEEA